MKKLPGGVFWFDQIYKIMTDCEILFTQILPGLSTKFLQFNPTLTGSNCCQYDLTRFTCQNQRLVSISLPDSNLDGSLVPEIGNLTFLQTLDLSNNLLQGSLPEEIGLLQNLEKLSLADNQLMIGAVPASLANLDSLIYLDLKSTGFQGPLSPTFSKRIFETGVTSKNSCPYESWLCTGTNPPTQNGCEVVCLQIGVPVLNDHNGDAQVTIPTRAKTITSTSATRRGSTVITTTRGSVGITTAINSVDTLKTISEISATPTGIVLGDNLNSSSNNSYLNYVIPISIIIVCLALALIYRLGRKTYVVGGKSVESGSLQSLARESTRIRESVLDQDKFGGFRVAIGQADDDVPVNVDLPQKTFVPKLFGESQAIESEVVLVLEDLANNTNLNKSDKLEAAEYSRNGEHEVDFGNSFVQIPEQEQAKFQDNIEIVPSQPLPPHPHQVKKGKFSFESFNSFE